MGESNFELPAESVSLIPSTNRTPAAHYELIHGYRVYAANATKPHPAWHVYDVPELRSRIALRGPLAPRILDTLAPSARNVALTFASQPQQTNYRDVVEAGVRLSIPPSWKVTTTAPTCSWPSSELVVPPVHPGLRRLRSCLPEGAVNPDTAARRGSRRRGPVQQSK